jgi:hypothetical protein
VARIVAQHPWFLAVLCIESFPRLVGLLIEYLPDLVRQRRHREGLLQEGHFRLKDAMSHDSVIGVAAEVQHLQTRPLAGQTFHEVAAAHLRHDHVGDQQVDLS